MVRFYYLNGQMMPAADARLHVSDLSILRGYGVFDFFRVSRGQALFLAEYLERFERSARLLQLILPFSRDEIAGGVRELIRMNGLQEAGIRLVLTGGYSADGYTPTTGNLLIMEHPFKAAPEEQFRQGARLLTYPYQREFPEAKSINYLTGIYLQPRLKQEGYHYVLFHDGTYLRESDRSNFFLITAGGRLVTPRDRVLLGVTRNQVIRLAEGLLDIEEREVALSEIATAREAFITSTTKGVMPVVQVDGQQIGDGKPGPLSGELSRRFLERVEAYIHSGDGT